MEVNTPVLTEAEGSATVPSLEYRAGMSLRGKSVFQVPASSLLRPSPSPSPSPLHPLEGLPFAVKGDKVTAGEGGDCEDLSTASKGCRSNFKCLEPAPTPAEDTAVSAADDTVTEKGAAGIGVMGSFGDSAPRIGYPDPIERAPSSGDFFIFSWSEVGSVESPMDFFKNN